MRPVEPIGGATAASQIHGSSIQQRCGHDGQRKRVAHMPTATTTKEDSHSKLVQNHPHDFTKMLNSKIQAFARNAEASSDACEPGLVPSVLYAVP
jgi:hypothetical protein